LGIGHIPIFLRGTHLVKKKKVFMVKYAELQVEHMSLMRVQESHVYYIRKLQFVL